MTDDARLREAVAAVRSLRDGGVRPLRAVVRAWSAGESLASVFADDLASARASPIEDPPGHWRPHTPDEAATLLAFLRHRTLAYDTPHGDPAEHRRVARRLVDALGVTRAWSNSDLLRVIDPATLSLPRGGYSYGTSYLLTGATFEEVALLEGDGLAALALWTDED